MRDYVTLRCSWNSSLRIHYCLADRYVQRAREQTGLVPRFYIPRALLECPFCSASLSNPDGEPFDPITGLPFEDPDPDDLAPERI